MTLLNGNGTLLITIIASTLMLVLTFVFLPWMIVRIPENYFACKECRVNPWRRQHPIVRLFLVVLKNVLGYVLVLAGILMLVLPGQGVLTILAGIFFLDFPGKYRLERFIVSRKPVLRSFNWIRKHAGRKPLRMEK